MLVATAKIAFTQSKTVAPGKTILSPAKAPTVSPIMRVPVMAPIVTPVMAPVVTPVMAPEVAPVTQPIPVPVTEPAIAPFPTTDTVPKLVGNWEDWEPYALDVAESLGGMIGDDFLVVAGFSGAWTIVTKSVYAYNTKDIKAKWRYMDDVPVCYRFTHSCFYYCGSNYVHLVADVGGTPDSNICLKYNHSAVVGLQWLSVPELPKGRGGSGMKHIKESDSLVNSSGASRRGKTIDYATT
jgi:hypothetical protein